MRNGISEYIDKARNLPVTLIFLVFLLVFIFDRAINYFYPFPFFVIFSLLSIPLLLVQRKFSPEAKKWLFPLVIIYLVVGITGNIVHSFHSKNISDLIFILLFFIFYLLYESDHAHFSVKWIHVFTVSMLVLFSFNFMGINSIKPVLSDKSRDKYVGPPTKTKQLQEQGKNADEQAENGENTSLVRNSKTLFSDSILKSLANPNLDYLEYTRIYHYGLFRVPQVASYIFGFLGLFYLYYFWNRRRILAVLAGLAMLFVALYTGTRIFPLTFLIVTVLWMALRPKRWPYLIFPAVLITLLIIFRYEIIRITDNTFTQQYFTFFVTAVDNLPRLSRVILWNSWLKEMHEFGILDLLIGKTFFGSIQANLKNAYIAEWFHNDYFSIVYSYGIVCLSLYVAFYMKIYRDNRVFIQNNFIVFAIFASMPVMAFLNGFYYYFPMFSLYIYFLIIQKEHTKLIAHENRNTGNQRHPQ